MIHVSVKNETPEASMFRYGTGRKEMTYNKLLSKLLENGQDLGEAVESIKSAWEESVPDPKGEQVEVTELNEATRELFKYFRWHSDPKGAVSLFCRINTEKEVYTHSAELIESAQSIHPPGMDESLYAWMWHKYAVLVKKQEISFYHQVLGNKKKFPGLNFYWKKWAEPIWKEDPAFQLLTTPVGISDRTDYPCFFYFNPADLKPGPYPNWKGWLQIIPKPLRAVFRAWVYSVFVPTNTGRQALWLHDNGYTGKTSVINAIAQYLGKDASGAISSGSMKTNFAFETIYGKRFVSYGDCAEPNLIRHPKIHSILGNDVVIVDQKNMKPFPARLHCRLLVASNLAPHININAHNERTRVLYIPLAEPTDDQLKKYCRLDEEGNVMRYESGSPMVIGGNLQQELFQEMEAFLASCKPHYDRLCSTGQDVLVTQEHLDIMEYHCISEEELTFRNLCEQLFLFGEEDSLPLRMVQQCFNIATSGTPYRSSGTSDFSRFKKFLMDRKAVVIEKTKGGGKLRVQMCFGIRINPDSGMISKLEHYLTQIEIKTYIIN